MEDLSSDRFRARQLIGRGAAADVYRAHDAALDRPVAVKMFRPGHDETALRRFTEETRTLAGLSHPGLVEVFSCGVEADRPYLVMRLVEGETLQSLLLSGPLSPGRTAELGARLADALAYVHRQGIVHRDVKPSNILLDDAGRPVLGDFGIAITADGTRMTRTNEIIGTPAYLAPEQVLGEDVGPATDVYSLGLTLLECLTGTTEYRAHSEVATAIARLHRAPRLPEGLPPRLAALLRAMTDKDPCGRPTAAQCAIDLQGAIEAQDAIEVRGAGTSVLSPQSVGPRKSVLPHKPVSARKSLRSRVIGSAVAAAATIAALVTGLVLMHQTAPAASTPRVAPAADNRPARTPPTTLSQAGTTTSKAASPAVVAVVGPATQKAAAPPNPGPADPPQPGPNHPPKPGHNKHGHGHGGS